jgi:hypothetical protein
MRSPRNVDEYLDLIEQALFEVGDLIACTEDEGDGDAEFTGMLPTLQKLEAGLKALQSEIRAGGYTLGAGEDLAFMAGVAAVRRRLPVAPLLDAISLTHKKGFEE